MQELRRIHAALHSAMDALIKDLNPNEAARLLILMDDKLTSLINASEVDGVGPAVVDSTAKQAPSSERKFKGTLPVERPAPASEPPGALDLPPPATLSGLSAPKAGSPRDALPHASSKPVSPVFPKEGPSSTVEFPLAVPAKPPKPEPELPVTAEVPVADEGPADLASSTVQFLPNFVSRRAKAEPIEPPAIEPGADLDAPADELEDEASPPEPARRFAPGRGVFQRFRSTVDHLLKPKSRQEDPQGRVPPLDEGDHEEEAQSHKAPEERMDDEVSDIDETPASAPAARSGLFGRLSFSKRRREPEGTDSTALPEYNDLSPAQEPEDMAAAGGDEAPAVKAPMMELPMFEFPGLELAARTKPIEAGDAEAVEPAPRPPESEAHPEPILPFAAPELVLRLHHIADISTASEILTEASLKTANRIELRKVDEGLDLLVKGLPKPLGTVRISDGGEGHVVYHPLFGLDIPGREPNRADLEMWMKAMSVVVVRVLDNITMRRQRRGATNDASTEAPGPDVGRPDEPES